MGVMTVSRQYQKPITLAGGGANNLVFNDQSDVASFTTEDPVSITNVNAANGDLLVWWALGNGPSGSFLGAPSSANSTWHGSKRLEAHDSGDATIAQIRYGKANAAMVNETVTFGGGGFNTKVAGIFSVTGAVTTDPVYDANVGLPAFSASGAELTVTLDGANRLILGLVWSFINDNQPNGAAGWQLVAGGGPPHYYLVMYKIVSASGSHLVDWTGSAVDVTAADAIKST